MVRTSKKIALIFFLLLIGSSLYAKKYAISGIFSNQELPRDTVLLTKNGMGLSYNVTENSGFLQESFYILVPATIKNGAYNVNLKKINVTSMYNNYGTFYQILDTNVFISSDDYNQPYINDYDNIVLIIEPDYLNYGYFYTD